METLRADATGSESLAGAATEIVNAATLSWLDEIARALRAKPFVPHPLFQSGHAQTIAAAVWPRRGRRLLGEDNDEARLFEVAPGVRVLVKCRWQAARHTSPTLLLVHGLEGSSESVYMPSAARKAYAAGFNVLRLNLRTCGDTLHLTETLYNSGLSPDLRAVVQELITRDHLTDIFIGGFSLGGNLTLKLAGEYGANFPSELKGVCAVSPSVDLAASAAAIERRSNWVYNRKFIRSLKRRMKDAARLYPERYDTAQLKFIRTIRDFDERITAPHGGFRDAADYYARSSSLPLIARIRVPTLIIHAQDDPFIPFDALRHPSVGANPHVILLAPARGGHVGFVSDDATAGEDRFWAEHRLVEFCQKLDLSRSVN